MKIHIVTIFPESFDSYFSSSILKKSIENKFLEVFFYKLNDFSDLPTKRVDSKAYWMHWQVLSPIYLSNAVDYIFSRLWKKIPVIYLTPSWDLLNQEYLEKFYENKGSKEFILICWHYEWVDQRFIDLYVDYEISIWEYVLTSWELSSMVFIDSLIRNIPGVLWNSLSLEEDSFSKKLDRQKEYPVYTRPEVFKGLHVPSVLISWDHKKINDWKNNNLR